MLGSVLESIKPLGAQGGVSCKKELQEMRLTL